MDRATKNRSPHANLPANSMYPQDGDVVIVRNDANPRTTYVVVRWLALPQFSCRSREAADQFARGFARTQLVDVWSCEGPSYMLLERNRSEQPQPV